MGSHSVTCHPTQVNAPRLTPARKADLPTRRDGRLSWPRWLATIRLHIASYRTRPQTVTHQSINWARRRATTLIKTNALSLSQAST